MIGFCGALFVTLLLLASPAGRFFDRALTEHFIAMNQRREQHRLSSWDGMQCQLLYASVATCGRVVSPEGGQVIWHYLCGRGTDLWLSPNYIRMSPVVVRSLAQLKEGESRQFGFHQAEDWRLSYAVNPFSIKKNQGSVFLWQRMEFDTRPGALTTLDYTIGQFRLPDALIYSMHPQPFTVYCKWKM